jgi:drug/metabolite transporter (DMT)-like permease
VCAVAYGISDFAGGLASRQTAVLRVLLVSQPAGAVAVLGFALLDSGSPEWRSAGVGAAAGVAGAVGLLLLYAGLATGPMSVVAPLTALCSAVVPVGAGIAMGERPGALALVGVALALAAVALVGREPGGGAGLPPRAVGLALLAGIGFGGFFVLLDVAADVGAANGGDVGTWPVVAARATGFVLVALVAVASRSSGGLPWSSVRLAVAAGVLEAVATVAYALALRSGLLALVAVIASLYPAATLLLARVLLKERMARSQQAGLAIAALSVALIAGSG